MVHRIVAPTLNQGSSTKDGIVWGLSASIERVLAEFVRQWAQIVMTAARSRQEDAANCAT